MLVGAVRKGESTFNLSRPGQVHALWRVQPLIGDLASKSRDTTTEKTCRWYFPRKERLRDIVASGWRTNWGQQMDYTWHTTFFWRAKSTIGCLHYDVLESDLATRKIAEYISINLNIITPTDSLRRSGHVIKNLVTFTKWDQRLWFHRFSRRNLAQKKHL